MRADTVREVADHLISKSAKDFKKINEMIVERQKSSTRLTALHKEIQARGTELYQLARDHSDYVEWGNLIEDLTKRGKPIKELFRMAVLRVFVFGKALSPYYKKLFNQSGVDAFKEQVASMIMAHSHSRHLFLKVDWDQMRWLGFVWKKGWHYNDINYGS